MKKWECSAVISAKGATLSHNVDSLIVYLFYYFFRKHMETLNCVNVNNNNFSVL